MRPFSRLLSVALALVLLGSSLLTASAHDNTQTPDADYDYGVYLTAGRIDDKTTVKVGTELKFSLRVWRTTNGHAVPSTAALRSVNSGGFSLDNFLGNDGLGGNNTFWTKDITYIVPQSDLGSATRRVVPIQFQLSYVPEDSDGSNPHSSVTVKSERILVVVVKTGASSSTGSSGVTVDDTMKPPASLAAGNKVEFTLQMVTGKYALRSTRTVHIRKQLYDAAGEEIGGLVRATTLQLRPLKTEATGPTVTGTYTLTTKDAEAATIEFSYEFVIEDSHLRDVDGNLPEDLDSDFSEPFKNKWVIGLAATPTPVPSPTPNPRVGSTSAATVTRTSGNVIHVNRVFGRDLFLTAGFLAPDGSRAFHQRGFIRDEDQNQTYAVVIREADDRVVRIWVSPDSPERLNVPWGTVNQNYTVPTDVILAIPLDETRPAENQLVRRFDFGGQGRIYVYRHGRWQWIPDIPTFEANGFYWCDVTAADADFFNRARALIGSPLPRSGGTQDPNYPVCHSK